MKSNRKKIILAGGGSGGHITPLISVWEIIKEEYDFVYIGVRGGVGLELVSDKKILMYQIMVGKWRRYFSLLNVVDVFKFVFGVFQSLIILSKEKPNLVLAKGGYVALPVSLAAWLMRIPVIAHESDTVMGLANRIIARFAVKIAVTFPLGNYPSKYQKKLVLTGMPVRNWRAKRSDESRYRKYFGIDNDLPIVLVMGGSQGAVGLNTYVLNNIFSMLDFTNVIHITGRTDLERVQKIAGKFGKKNGKYLIFDFMLKDYEKAIFIADLIVSRSGSTSLSEISSLSKPSILVPLPTSASNHQFHNAKSFEDVGASILVEERDFDKINLSILIKSLFEDEERYEEMRASASTAMMTDGSSQILADLIADVLKGKSNNTNLS